MAEQQELKPIQELITPEGYRWSTYSKEQTGLMLVCLEDTSTGVVTTTTIADPEIRTAAHRAWAGARHSRAAGMPWEIMNEMGRKGIDPDEKLEDMFANYGHASVGDMARLEVDIVNVPMHVALAVFNGGFINSGQEKSTRYQSRFGRVALHSMRHYLPSGLPESELVELEGQYQQFGSSALGLFAEYRERLTAAFTDFYKPDKGQEGNLGSRVLDNVRYFLPLGLGSGFSYETSARDWSRTIGELKASPIPFYRRVAGQVERLLAPTSEEELQLKFKAESPSLIRHTEPAYIVNDNLSNLKKFLEEKTDLLQHFPVNTEFKGKVMQEVKMLPRQFKEGEKMVAQYLMSIWPNIGDNPLKLLQWIKDQDLAKEISRIILDGHDNYHELPGPLASSRGESLIFSSYLGEVRDFNRHRAWGRFVPLPLVYGLEWDSSTADQVLARGYGLPLYLSDVEEFAQPAREFEVDLKLYYEKLELFKDTVVTKYGSNIDYSFLVNLLPLAHQMDIWMHGDPKGSLYLPDRRVKSAGHINYRALAYDANRLIADSDLYLEGLRFIDNRPDAASRKEFFDRS